jgi:hypothetical protein
VTAPVTPSGPTPTPGTWDDNYPSADGNGNIYYTSNNAVTGSGIYCVKSDGTGTQKIESGAAYRGLEVSEDGQFLFEQLYRTSLGMGRHGSLTQQRCFIILIMVHTSV